MDNRGFRGIVLRRFGYPGYRGYPAFVCTANRHAKLKGNNECNESSNQNNLNINNSVTRVHAHCAAASSCCCRRHYCCCCCCCFWFWCRLSCIIKCLGQSFDAWPCQWVFGQLPTGSSIVVALALAVATCHLLVGLPLFSGHRTK